MQNKIISGRIAASQASVSAIRLPLSTSQWPLSTRVKVSDICGLHASSPAITIWEHVMIGTPYPDQRGGLFTAYMAHS